MSFVSFCFHLQNRDHNSSYKSTIFVIWHVVGVQKMVAVFILIFVIIAFLFSTPRGQGIMTVFFFYLILKLLTYYLYWPPKQNGEHSQMRMRLGGILSKGTVSV